MKYPLFFDSKNTLNLYGLEKNFQFITNLYSRKKLPKVLMLTGNKGSGKSTLVNHFLFSIFDKANYNKEKFLISKSSYILDQFQNNIFSNIIYVSGAVFKSVKIEDIRILKSRILQSTILNKDRFIIFDDIELFNHNSLNALLKIIEEPSIKNFFFLINNKTKPLLETVKSRALEIKITLNEEQRLEIINNLVNLYKIEMFLDPKLSELSPGNFIKFNYLCKEHNISTSNHFVENLTLILNLYKKNKDIVFLNLILFMTDYYFKSLKNNNLTKNKTFEIKNYIFDNLNTFMMYNISQNSLINAISEKLNYE